MDLTISVGSARRILARTIISTTSIRLSPASIFATKDWVRPTRDASSAWVNPASNRACFNADVRARCPSLRRTGPTVGDSRLRKFEQCANPEIELSQNRFFLLGKNSDSGKSWLFGRYVGIGWRIMSARTSLQILNLVHLSTFTDRV